MENDKVRADLLHEMKVTKGTRFNAARRLELRDRQMIRVTSFTSVCLIALTILPLFFHVSEFLNATIAIATIILSLVILAASLLQYSNNDPVKAEQHHRCALEINALHRELRSKSECSSDTLFTFGRRYDDILQRYNTNHDEIDFIKYKLDHSNEYPLEADKILRKRARYSRIDLSYASIKTMAAVVIAIYIAAFISDPARILAVIINYIKTHTGI